MVMVEAELRALLMDDEGSVRRSVARNLRAAAALDVKEAGSSRDAIRIVVAEPLDIRPFREPHGCSLRTSVRRIEVEAAAVEVDRRLEVLDVAITAGALLDGLDGGVEPFADSVRDSMRVVRQDVV